MSEDFEMPSVEVLESHLLETKLDSDSETFFRTVAFSIYLIGKSPGSYFFHHPRDEFPRVRKRGVSVWIDCSEDFPIFLVQRDDFSWAECEYECVVPLGDVRSVEKDIGYVTSNIDTALSLLSLLVLTVKDDEERNLNSRIIHNGLETRNKNIRSIKIYKKEIKYAEPELSYILRDNSIDSD